MGLRLSPDWASRSPYLGLHWTAAAWDPSQSSIPVYCLLDNFSLPPLRPAVCSTYADSEPGMLSIEADSVSRVDPE